MNTQKTLIPLSTDVGLATQFAGPCFGTSQRPAPIPGQCKESRAGSDGAHHVCMRDPYFAHELI